MLTQNFTPKSLNGKVSEKQLLEILNSEPDPSKLCFFYNHDWIEYLLDPATKRHRVCIWCLKKQKSATIIKFLNRWENE